MSDQLYGELTDQHPCTQSSEQLEVFRWAQLSKQLRNHKADPAAGLTTQKLPPAQPGPVGRSSASGFQWGYRNFYCSLFYSPSLKRELLWLITSMPNSSKSTLCATTDRGIWGTSIKTALPLAGRGASSSQESSTCKVSGSLLWL